MNKMPGFLWLEADAVVREGYDAVMKGRAVVVNGAIYRVLIWLTGTLPRGLSRWVSGSAGRRYRKT
jgi:short-subunit dehydrogenase